MHIRVIKRKDCQYLIVEDGYRENGKNVTKYIKTLARYDIAIEHNPNILQELRDLLKKDKAQFILNYINNDGFINIYNKNIQSSIIYAVSKVNVGCSVYKVIWEKLKLNSLIKRIAKKYQIQYSLNDISCYLATMRIMDPSSKLNAFEKSNRYEIGVDYKLDTFYRSLDILAEHKDNIETHLFKQTCNLMPVNERRIVLYDVSTFYFDSTEKEDLKDFGFSKDNKVNQVQVVYGLTVLDNGLPICSEVFSGNTSETKTLESMLISLKKKFKVNNITIIADRGITSMVNCKKVIDAGFSYVFAFRIKSSSKELQNKILTSNLQANPSQTQEYSYEIKGKDEEGKIFSIPSRLIVAYSQSRANKDNADITKFEEKAIHMIDNPSMIDFSKRGPRKYIKQVKNKKTAPKLDIESIERDRQFAGYYGLCTSDNNLDAKEVNDTYRCLWIIEESFRIMKTNLKTRPIYHWTPKRIQGHFVISFIALYMQRYLELQLKSKNYNYSIHEIQDTLNEVLYLKKSNGEKLCYGYDNQCYIDILSVIY